jgi:hypothetical protein
VTTIGSAWGFLACQGGENLLFGTSCSSATSSSSLFFMDWIWGVADGIQIKIQLPNMDS